MSFSKKGMFETLGNYRMIIHRRGSFSHFSQKGICRKLLLYDLTFSGFHVNFAGKNVQVQTWAKHLDERLKAVMKMLEMGVNIMLLWEMLDDWVVFSTIFYFHPANWGR